MYIDGWMIFAIYFIAVTAMAVSVYALWSLEEIRRYYEKRNNKSNIVKSHRTVVHNTKPKTKSHWD